MSDTTYFGSAVTLKQGENELDYFCQAHTWRHNVWSALKGALQRSLTKLWNIFGIQGLYFPNPLQLEVSECIVYKQSDRQSTLQPCYGASALSSTSCRPEATVGLAIAPSATPITRHFNDVISVSNRKKKQKKRTVWFGFGFNMLRFRSGSIPAWRNKNLSLFANRFATVHHFGTVYFILPHGNTLNSTIDLSAWSMRKFHQEAENYKWITRTQGNFHVLIRNRGN